MATAAPMAVLMKFTTCTYAHAYTHMQIHADTRVHTIVHVIKQIDATHKHTHTHTYTHTHTHTHTHSTYTHRNKPKNIPRILQGGPNYEIALSCRSLSATQPLIVWKERWGAGVATQKNVRGEIGGLGRVPFNEPYAPSLSTIYDGA